MTTQPPNAGAANALIERVRNIILKPSEEWDRIAAEPGRIDRLYGGYLLPIVGVVALATFVLTVLTSLFSLSGPLFAAIFYLVTALAVTFAMAIVINALAPTFASQRDDIAAHKLAVYSATPWLLTHIFNAHPMLSPISILGLYAFFLIYVGLPKLMKTPEEKRLPYVGAILLASLIVAVVLGAIVQITGGGWGGRYYAPVAANTATSPNAGGVQLSYPGGSLDAEELAKMKREAQQAASRSAAETPPETLQETPQGAAPPPA